MHTIRSPQRIPIGLFVLILGQLPACTINLDPTGTWHASGGAAGAGGSSTAGGGAAGGTGGVVAAGVHTGIGGAMGPIDPAAGGTVAWDPQCPFGFWDHDANPGTPCISTTPPPPPAGLIDSGGPSITDTGISVTTDAGETTVRFAFTGALQTWTVPAGVTSISVDARGAQGGSTAHDPTAPFAPGGWGARVQATLSVEPGETIQIFVGGAGGDPVFPNTAGLGGWNGGGNGADDNVDFNGPSSGGGGASDIRQGGSALINRVIVAAGGGGSEGYHDGPGAAGGGETGADGQCMGNECMCAGGGGGATLTNGGFGGTGCNGDGETGTFGKGGAGGKGNRAGGGGGGGYFGGGGGGGCCLGAGGGAGSSFAPQAGAIFSEGAQSGNGEIVITFANSDASNADAGSPVSADAGASCAADGGTDCGTPAQ